jgi:hypothetical protein
LSIWCSVHHYFPLLSWSSCVSVAQSFVVYMVFCPPLFPPSFLVIVFWCCPVFCCLYGVLSTIISPFFPGHRVFCHSDYDSATEWSSVITIISYGLLLITLFLSLVIIVRVVNIVPLCSLILIIML